MKRQTVQRQAIWLACTVPSLALLAVFWWPVVDWLIAFKELAGWAQVVGSVLAIFGAVYAANLSSLHQQKAVDQAAVKWKQDTQRLAGILADVASARLSATELMLTDHPMTVPVAGWTVSLRTVEADLAVMKALHLHDLEDREPMQTFALLIGLMRSVCDYLEPLTDGSLQADAKRQKYIETTREYVSRLRETVATLSDKLHRDLGLDRKAISPAGG